MASLADALKLYAKVSLVVATSGYGYLYYRCKKLREDAMDFDLI